MPAATRLYGHMLAACTIDGVSYLLDCESVEIAFELETKPGRAVRDVWKFPIPVDGGWIAHGNFFIDAASPSAMWTSALAMVPVSVVVQDSASGNTFMGNALITGLTQRIIDNAQVWDTTLTGQGALTMR